MSFEVVHWTEWVRALGPAIIACIVAYIAYQQWKLAQATLREKLFERRFEVFSDVHLVLSELPQIGDPNKTAVPRVQDASRRSRFLFGDDVTDYLVEVWNKISELQRLQHQFEMLSEGPERNSIRRQLLETDKWVFEASGNIFEVFSPYLRFDLKN